jgi:hypothetical protein
MHVKEKPVHKTRLAMAATLVIATMGFLAGPASAAGRGAQKQDLLANSFGSCTSGPAGGTPGVGFAVINQNGNGTITAEVSLKGATPNHVYTLEIVQTPSGASCGTGQATLTTNGQGNGNAHVSVAADPGTTDAFVMINPSDSLGYITTNDVVLS